MLWPRQNPERVSGEIIACSLLFQATFPGVMWETFIPIMLQLYILQFRVPHIICSFVRPLPDLRSRRLSRHDAGKGKKKCISLRQQSVWPQFCKQGYSASEVRPFQDANAGIAIVDETVNLPDFTRTRNIQGYRYSLLHSCVYITQKILQS